MWTEQFKNKEGKTKYRFYEKYKDPYTDKWRRVSVVMNKDTKASQKEAMFQLDDKIQSKLKTVGLKSSNNITVEQAIDEWFEHYKIHSGVKKSSIKTKISSINLLKKVMPENTLLKNLSLPTVNKIFNDFFKEGFSRNVNKEVLGIFKHSLKHAHKSYSDINIEYLNELKAPKETKDYEQLMNEKNNYLEKAQLKQLINYFSEKAHQSKKAHHKRLNLFLSFIIEIQAMNGMRIGELLAIKEDDIDLVEKTLSINGTMLWEISEDGFGVKESTKTDTSFRTIGLTDRSCEIFKKAILENKVAARWNNSYTNRNFVFSNYKGNPFHPNIINKKLKEATKELEFNKNVTTHTLRHTHISFLAELGLELKSIMNRVGHNNPDTTIKIYTHVTKKMEKDVIDKLESFKIM
ncbi:tyrosine-type recombinase/integrase [Staphylococcus pseudoxylosus]|uniref:Site-specific integrase n=1 Tax=Staphylococcus pseudoxylosus TaxID=2282419 RepID=A0AAQ0MJP9_9STAP|nr:site-specific integrase [Staphylococcus pseudoxylosus]RMI86522.1 site-specific integrase [Staphylococcus pseudoxylosus]